MFLVWNIGEQVVVLGEEQCLSSPCKAIGWRWLSLDSLSGVDGGLCPSIPRWRDSQNFLLLIYIGLWIPLSEWNHYVLFKGGYLLSRFPWYVLSEGIGHFKSLCFHLIAEWLVGVGGRSSRVPVSTESWCFILEPSPSFSKIWLKDDSCKWP